MSKKKLIIIISTSLAVVLVAATLLILLLPVNVTLYNGDEKLNKISGKAGSNIELTRPEAPENQYFVGWYTDKNLTKYYSGNTYKRFTNKLYAKFNDYLTECTDSFENKDLSIKLPNVSDTYFASSERFGLCFKEFCDDGIKLADTEKWSTPGAVIITDKDGYPFIAKPSTHYTITLTYKINGIGSTAIKISSGYGLKASATQKLKDTEFTKLNSAKTYKEKTDDFVTDTYSFSTNKLEDVLGVVGVYVTLNTGDEMIIKEIKIEESEVEVEETNEMSETTQQTTIVEVDPNAPKLIALTFDDGPNDTFKGFVDIFKKYNGKCTFMLVGKNITENQKDGLQYALNAGFQFANHSYTHTSMPTLSEEEMLNEYNKTDEALYNLVGAHTSGLRLPGLKGNDTVYRVFKEAGIPLIGAGGATTDWAGTTTTAEEVANSCLKQCSDGKIICMHATEKTLSAMSVVLPKLKEQNYTFVTVDELFKQKGYSSIPLGSELTIAVQK